MYTYNLQLHSLAIELDSPDLEVHADGRDVALSVGVVGETQQQARLSDAGVTDKQQLEEVVVSVEVWVSTCSRVVQCGQPVSRWLSIVAVCELNAGWVVVILCERCTVSNMSKIRYGCLQCRRMCAVAIT